jgi:hypothetical protein
VDTSSFGKKESNDAETKNCISAGVPATDGRVDPVGRNPEERRVVVIGTNVYWLIHVIQKTQLAARNDAISDGDHPGCAKILQARVFSRLLSGAYP